LGRSERIAPGFHLRKAGLGQLLVGGLRQRAEALHKLSLQQRDRSFLAALLNTLFDTLLPAFLPAAFLPYFDAIIDEQLLK
jgi:hypothetical protein